MHLFTDYVQPLTDWLYTNPEWALLITFLISFTESLAIIGSIIPGSITMTAIGILAGSGVMRIDFTFYAATLGAIAGDSGSYFIGYIFSDRLIEMWPFRKYPHWLNYGKEYFAKHGGKSVLIGRFAGPLRSIIPVIAGMMRMRQLHFLLANIASAIGWAILYVLPGVLIGAASNELSPERATFLFGFILALLVIIWLVARGIKWILIRGQQTLRLKLDKLWHWSEKKPMLSPYLKKLTPAYETSHHKTIALISLFSISLIISTMLILCITHHSCINEINHATLLFLQSLRTHYFDIVFIITNFLLNPWVLSGFLFTLIIASLIQHNWHLICYILLLTITSISIAAFLNAMIQYKPPGNAVRYAICSTSPAIYLTLATSLFSFLICYLSLPRQTRVSITLRALLIALLIIAGFSPLYLGDNWLSSIVLAYSVGISIGLFYWILFRRQQAKQSQFSTLLFIAILSFIPSVSIQCVLHFQSTLNQHHLFSQQHELTYDNWWNQTQPILPLFTTNRIGKPTGIFNIQFVGSIDKLEDVLTDYGWEIQPNTFLYSLSIRAGKLRITNDFPLMPQLYLNEKPVLTMSYQSDDGELYILRLWHSNYHLQQDLQPIWLGSIIYPEDATKRENLFTYLLPALNAFNYNKKKLKPHTNVNPPLAYDLLVIENKK